MLLCAYLCLFGSQKHNIFLLPWLLLTPSLACGLLEPLAPPSWLLYKLLQPLMLICASLCLFVVICAYLALKNIIFLFSPGSCSPRPWLGGSYSLSPPSWLLYKLLEPLMLICASLCLFGSQNHNIFLLPWLLLTPSLACGLLEPLAPPSWLLYKLLEPLMLLCASLCLFGSQNIIFLFSLGSGSPRPSSSCSIPPSSCFSCVVLV